MDIQGASCLRDSQTWHQQGLPRCKGREGQMRWSEPLQEREPVVSAPAHSAGWALSPGLSGLREKPVPDVSYLSTESSLSAGNLALGSRLQNQRRFILAKTASS